MPVLPTSSRLFAPVTSRPLRVRATVGVFDDSDAPQSPVAQVRRGPEGPEPRVAEPSTLLEDLVSVLDDAEIDEMDTEAFEAVVAQMRGRGHRQAHARGFVNLRA